MPEFREALPIAATHVGFVGATAGMTSPQLFRVYALLLDCGAVELHHGGRVGADEQVHDLADHLGLWRMVHPATTLHRQGAYTGDMVFSAKADTERYHDIVNAVGVLIAAPRSVEERSGGRTWSTVVYAIKVGRPVVIVGPNGHTVRVNRRRRA